HFAKDCPVDDICGNCSGKHRMVDCPITDLDRYKCTNCNSSGHTSWDRMCPS
ncbi:hypothetical protein BU17DRAFT_14481, partial [Hysterangium stoloniferum]